MGRESPVVYGMPEGRKLPSPGGDDRIGEVYSLTKDRKGLRRGLRRQGLEEIDARDIEQRGNLWVTKAGIEFELLRCWVDPIAATDSPATAFTTQGDYVLYLRPVDAEEKVEIVELGVMTGRQA